MISSPTNEEYYYMLLTNVIPNREYQLSDAYTLKEATHSRRLRENSYSILPEVLQHFHAYLALPSLDDNSFRFYRDLVLFHSFITGDANTYLYGEQSENVTLDRSKLTFPKSPRVSINPSLQYINYDSFPIQVRTSWNDELPVEYTLNYQKAFALFESMKQDKVNNKLFNLINLWVFASGYQSLTRLYNNTNLAITMFIIILEAIIDRPKSCKNVIEKCTLCKREKISHDSVTRTTLFSSQYGDRFNSLLKLRHGTVHEGAYNDIIISLFERLENNSNQKQDKPRNDVELLDNLEETARLHLLRLFMKQYDA